jgi:uncharacterized protein YhjY with autotransporter beta-barrel domain
MRHRSSWHGGAWVYPSVVLFCLTVVATVQAQSQTSPPPNFQGVSNLSDAQQSIAIGTDTFCDSDAGRETALNDSLCGGGFRGGVQAGNTGEADARIGLQQLAYEEVIAQGTNAVETSNLQFANIGARLAALRGGVTSLSLRRFALQLDQPVPHTLVASLVPYAAAAAAVPTRTPAVFNRLGLFVNGLFGFGDKDPTSREAGFDYGRYGVTGGLDYRFTRNLIMGLAFGYSATDTDLDASSGNLDTDSYTASAYGTYYVADKFYIDAIISVGWHDFDSTRNIRYTFIDAGGTTRRVDQTALGNTDGTQYAFSVGMGYDLHSGGWTVGPFGRINYSRTDIDGYREAIRINPADTGETGQNLTINDQEITSITSVLGGQISYAISTASGVLLPQLRFEWVHEFDDDVRQITASYVADPGSTVLSISTDAPDRDFFNFGAGVSLTLRGGISAFAYYETVLGLDNVTAHNVAFGVRVEL